MEGRGGESKTVEQRKLYGEDWKKKEELCEGDRGIRDGKRRCTRMGRVGSGREREKWWNGKNCVMERVEQKG